MTDDVHFDLDTVEGQPEYKPRVSKLTQWVIKYSKGLVKNEESANYVLLGFVVVAIIISLFLILGGDEAQVPQVRKF